MKTILQSLKTGAVELAEIPCPQAGPGQLLISSKLSLISAGTERMLLDFGKASYIQKARQQPEKVKMVLEKISTDGLLTTVEAVRSKLAQPLQLGYCNVGVVAEVGPGVNGFQPGDRVVSNGPHAEMVRVGKNLCAHVPDGVQDESAVFTVAASIGLQGVRLMQPTLGEAVAVIGVGLIGLLTVQLLQAHGCRVLAIDFDSSKLDLAHRFGAQICDLGQGDDPIAAAMAFSRGNGMDGVIIAASAKSNDPVSQAARMSRKRGRIVLVGVTGLELNRSDFYAKELSFQVSCSYGPGRYDPAFEERGQDYPFGFVRWTEQRNFEAVLDMMSSGRLNVDPLITHRFAIDDAPRAYDTLGKGGASLGILLEYPSAVESRKVSEVRLRNEGVGGAAMPSVGFVGAGNYASRVLIPAFKSAGASLRTIVTSSGFSGAVHGKRAGFAKASTDVDAMLADGSINTIAIVTRHDSHARLVIQALKAGRHVFVEKPLAVTVDELESVQETYISLAGRDNAPRLMVGFNRRFAPQIQKIRELLKSVGEPKTFIMTMNAGAIPAEHWTQDPTAGGGRIIGEACHFIDLMRYLANSSIVSVQARRMGDAPGVLVSEDKAAIVLGFADGSFGTIHYLANGAASFPKERIEIFAGGRILQLDNFLKLKGFGWPGFKRFNLWRQDKGQKRCVEAFVQALKTGGPAPIPAEEIFEVARTSIRAAEILRGQQG